MGMFQSRAYVEVFPGVHLPKDEPLPSKLRQSLDINWFTVNRAIFTYALSGGSGSDFVGKEKKPNSLDEAQRVALGKIGLKALSDDFKIFGTDDHPKNLSLLLKTNPWMAMSLLPYGRNGFELKAFDDSEKNPNMFLKIMRTMTIKKPCAGGRVNFIFDSDMNIVSFEAYDNLEAKKVVDPDLKFWAAAAIYNLIFVASCIHATLHVLHYLLTSGLDIASAHYPTLQKWAETYDDNIGFKYLQVYALLIREPAKDDAVITGDFGFGAADIATPNIRDVLQNDVLYAWSKCESLEDFMNFTFNKQVYDSSNILVEFKKHVNLITDFSSACVKSLSTINPEAFAQTESKLAIYLEKCGDFGKYNKITTVKNWIEIMCVTGIIHGSTLSYTRLLGVVDIVKWRNILQKNWDSYDQNLINILLGTISGMEPERHVMTADLTEASRSIFNIFAKKFDPGFQKVLREFDDRTTKLKEEHKKKLLEDVEILNNYGFILTDFAPDDFDGKQCTIATYI